MSRGLIDDREAVRRARQVFADMAVEVDPRARVSELSTAYWQLTEIAKALAQNAQVLIMDEPTASLARHETEALFELIDRLKARGIAIVYISHRMDEVYRIADRITILRDGNRLLTERLADITPAQIVEGIVGKELGAEMAYRERGHEAFGEILLEARNLNAPPRVNDVSFTLQAGEILGLAGLMGSGRTELARVLFGIDAPRSGEITIRGRRVNLSSPQRAISSGLALIPEDRREQGLVLDHSVRENLLLPLLKKVQNGILLSKRQRSIAVRRPDQTVHGQGRPPQPAGPAALGRQPAEGSARQMAGHRPGRVDLGRTHRRCRHRHQERDPRDDPRAGRRRQGRHRHLLGVSRTARGQRPHSHPARRGCGRRGSRAATSPTRKPSN